MASPRKFLNGHVRVALIVIIFSLAFPPSKPVGLSFSGYDENVKQRKQVLGSRPPRCIGKCLNCKPCMAALVIPPHKRQRTSVKISSHQQDGSYYLLSWKCRCGDKYFQP